MPCTSGMVRLSPACSAKEAAPPPSKDSSSADWAPSAVRRTAVTISLALPGMVRVKGKTLFAGAVRPGSASTALTTVSEAGAASASRPLLPR